MERVNKHPALRVPGQPWWHVGGEASVSSLILSSLIRKQALTVGVYMCNLHSSIIKCDFVFKVYGLRENYLYYASL